MGDPAFCPKTHLQYASPSASEIQSGFLASLLQEYYFAVQGAKFRSLKCLTFRKRRSNFLLS